MEEWTVNLIAVLVIVVIVVPITMIVIDDQKKSIRAHLEKKGAKNIKISWQPFDFDRSNHTYTVEYDDAEGKHQIRFCKVHTWSSTIYWED